MWSRQQSRKASEIDLKPGPEKALHGIFTQSHRRCGACWVASAVLSTLLIDLVLTTSLQGGSYCYLQILMGKWRPRKVKELPGSLPRTLKAESVLMATGPRRENVAIGPSTWRGEWKPEWQAESGSVTGVWMEG